MLCSMNSKYPRIWKYLQGKKKQLQMGEILNSDNINWGYTNARGTATAKQVNCYEFPTFENLFGNIWITFAKIECCRSSTLHLPCTNLHFHEIMKVETEWGWTFVEAGILSNTTSALPQGHRDREGEDSNHFCITKCSLKKSKSHD